MSTSPPDPDRLLAAGLDRRFYALVLDRLVAWLWYALAALVAWLLFWSSGRLGWGLVLVGLAVAALLAAYAVALGRTGATPGKAALGLRLLRVEDGEPIGVPQALLRVLLLGLAGAPTFGFGLASLAWTAVTDGSGRRQGWHDRLGECWVVDARPAPVPPPPVEEAPRQVVNLTALRLRPVQPTTEGEDASAPVAADRAVPAPTPPAARAGAHRAPSTQPRAAAPAGLHRRGDPPPAGEGTVVRRPPESRMRWRVSFDTGEQVLVEGLGLVGRRPQGRPGEDVRHLVTLGSADLSLSKTHAQFHLAEGALVMMDRGSTNGTVLLRNGVSRDLAGGKPATLLPGDRVRLGDREMTVSREG